MRGFLTKILVFSIISFLAISSPGQVYTPFNFSEGATWSHTECGYKPDWGAVYKFQISGDTLINQTFYKKIYYQVKWGDGVCSDCDFTFNTDSATLFAMIRQNVQDKKVYFIYPYASDKEWLGYDFDITFVGQSINGFSLIFTTDPEYPVAGIYVYQLIVDDIDSICVNEEYRRRFYFGPGNAGNIYHLAEYWIDGIGSTQGLLVQGFGGPNWQHGLYCFHIKDGSIYYDSTGVLDCVVRSSLSCTNGLDCPPVTGLKLIDNTNPIQIYPNPVKSQLIVECKIQATKLELTFYDIMGQKVITKLLHHPDEVSVVSLNELPSGFYYLTIQAGDFFTAKKIIKE